MNPIGGYFELELRKGKEFHPDAFALNTGRNALELILKVKKYKKVYIPYYTCEVILEPFKKTNTAYEFYSIDENLEPIFDYTIINENEGFLYINYFGLKDSFTFKLVIKCKNLIIDNSQAFFSKPIQNIPTFFSCRKFFGVSDGAYLYIKGVNISDIPFDVSLDRFSHLIKRIEYGAEEGYKDYKKNENNLIGQPIKQMSKLTHSLLGNVDYEYIHKKRIDNFLFLQKELSKQNGLMIDTIGDSVPMIYPFLTNKTNLRQRLADNKFFIATYWPEVREWTDRNQLEYNLSGQMLPLPIDQRYDENQLSRMIELLK